MISNPSTRSSSFTEIIRHRSTEEPDALVYTFLTRGDETVPVTCAELDHRARTIAAWLQQLGVSGERVLLVYPQGLDFVSALYGCLYAGAIAVPAYPPHTTQTARTISRLATIIGDASPSLALVAPEFAGAMEGLRRTIGRERSLRCLPLPEDTGCSEKEWKPVRVRPSDVVLLQYTSGSTADPKGVIITHSNLLSNCEHMKRAYGLQRGQCCVSWLPPFHDMGLIGATFLPAYSGLTAHLMSPFAFLQRPVRWLKHISSFRAYISGGPNFAYDLCVRRISSEEKKHLDLSCWKVAFNGAEPVQPKTLERFAAAFRECGFSSDAFYPSYGLAEATLMVSAARQKVSTRVLTLSRSALENNRVEIKAESDTGDICCTVGCGEAGDNVAIVSPETLTGCTENQVGEIWVSGESIAQGYWDRPEETYSTFNAYRTDTGEGPFLRTGDLGFIKDGQLFVSGRLKDLLIIAGRNHYPNDIETTVEKSHASIRSGCCAAFTIVVEEEDRLVVAAELDRRPGANGSNDHVEVRLAIKGAVAETHGVQVHAVALLKHGSIPKTSSGKIQRRECHGAFIRGEFNLIGD